MVTMLDGILAYFGYAPAGTPREYPRLNNGGDAVARGHRYEQFYAEEGGVRDMILSLRHDYFEKVGALKPSDVDSLRALGMADRIAREIDRKFREVIETGKLREHDQQHANKIAAIR